MRRRDIRLVTSKADRLDQAEPPQHLEIGDWEVRPHEGVLH